MLDAKAKRPCCFVTKSCRQSTALNADGPSTIADWLNISHELRTPAHAILGHAELLLSGAMGPLSCDMRASLGDIQKAGIGLLTQIEQAIKIGQEFLLTSPPSSTPDDLIDLLDLAWSRGQSALDAGMGMPRLGRSGQPPTWSSGWLRVTAMLLHDLGATPFCAVLPERSPDFPSMCDQGHSHASELRLEYPHVNHVDVSVHLRIIKEALIMTGGTLDHEPGQLVLTWPSGERQL